MRIFMKKNVKIASAWGIRPRTTFAPGGWGLHLQTPTLLFPPIVTTLSHSFLALKCVLLP